MVWRSAGRAERDLAPQLLEQTVPLGDDVVLVDRLEVLLAGGDERAAVELGEGLDDPADHLTHAVLDEAGPAVGLLDDLDLVGALHQLVDLRGHAGLGDRQQRRRIDLGRAVLDAAELQRGLPALVVGRDGHAAQDPLDLLRAEPLAGEALAGAGGDQLLGAGTGGDAGCRDADDAPRAVLVGDGAPEQRVDLLCLNAGDGGRLVLRIARRDRDLGARRALALADQLRDVLRERLGAEHRLAEHDLADRLVDDLVEARHVRALLVRGEVDEAVEAREVELLADPHDLLDARHADAGETRRGCRAGAPARRRRRPARGTSRCWKSRPSPSSSLARGAPAESLS